MEHRRSAEVRSDILRATARVVARDGAEKLTVNSAAKEACLSVGGLRYHFPSKRELLVGLVAHTVDGFDQAIAAAGTAPGDRTMAYIAATLTDSGDCEPAAALVAAAAVDSSLLDVLRQHFRRWQTALDDDGVDPAIATLVRLTMDGWWLAAFLKLAPPGRRRTAEIRTQLEHLVAQGVKGV
ncbi:TetR/AcrR family transcriptional regulator [Nakamurella aerolata]|uniref:TetR/AcrR family transcriptional regulator n=1 Tax=Nakamurella aerolata TaxID=1656892 RepID=A0A849ABX4_9ACTN|nr:TetR/AcrR family transcriptional regulator [Nakamurella aerolata]NNG36638.1 TetR/AcrR family transcriptional regulator [Nakamurella aerolata]